jgi:magnesium-transporting ATPase (P-type)
MIQAQSTVIRDGKRLLVNSKELVPGDVIHLRTGDKVPADCILFYLNEIKVDGSNLTGESDPFHRTTKHEGSPLDTDPFDSPHVLFSSDVIVTGKRYFTKAKGLRLWFKRGRIVVSEKSTSWRTAYCLKHHLLLWRYADFANRSLFSRL